MNETGQALSELILTLSLILLVVLSGIKVGQTIQAGFKHDFIEKKLELSKSGKNTDSQDFKIKFSKQLMFFKSKKDRELFKKTHENAPTLIFKDLGIIL